MWISKKECWKKLEVTGYDAILYSESQKKSVESVVLIAHHVWGYPESQKKSVERLINALFIKIAIIESQKKSVESAIPIPTASFKSRISKKECWKYVGSMYVRPYFFNRIS